MAETYQYDDLTHDSELDPDPVAAFKHWFDRAKTTEHSVPDAMTLSTVSAEGQPKSRIVLLKDFGPDGFVFYTNYKSSKADEMALNARVALTFHWKIQGTQVRIEGTVEKVSEEVSRKYFSSRPRDSRLSAWVSDQSSTIPDRAYLEEKLLELEAKYPGDDIPLPPFWGGYRVTPNRFEFWMGKPDRLHDRFEYILEDGAWQRLRLAP